MPKSTASLSFHSRSHSTASTSATASTLQTTSSTAASWPAQQRPARSRHPTNSRPHIAPFWTRIPKETSSQFTSVHACQAPVSYTHLRAHETRHDLVCRLLLEKKKNTGKDNHHPPSSAADDTAKENQNKEE